MDWLNTIHLILVVVQRSVSFLGVLIIVSGVLLALGQYIYFVFNGRLLKKEDNMNTLRLNLGRVLILGLEFIVAADLIGTTTAPDYYSVGLLAIIVVVRTILSYSINKELTMLSKER